MAWNRLDAFGYVALDATTEVSVELNPRYAYKLVHTGVDAAGNDDANSALTAWISTSSGAITADTVWDEDEKLWILDAGNQTLGPGINKLYLISTANADGVIQIIRQGSYEQW